MNTAVDGQLRQHTVKAASWRYSSVAVQFATQFVVGIALARILAPKDFGIVGLAMIVIGFGQLFSDLGIGPSLIQRQIITEQHIRVAFTLTLLVGAIVAGLVYFTAPIAAWVFKNTAVIPIVRVLSANLIITSIGTVSRALLQRQLNYKRLFFVEVISFIAGYSLVSITLALTGMGAWSLVWGAIVQSSLATSLLLIFAPHRLTPSLAQHEIQELAGFSIGMALSRVANYFALQGDYFVVGRTMGLNELGLYTRAYQLMRMPSTYTVNVLSQVLFPAASRLQDRPERLRPIYYQTLVGTGLLMFPVMGLLAILAPDLIVTLYGERWAPTIIPLQILTLSGPGQALYHLAAVFANARGRVYPIFVCQIIYGMAVVISSYFLGRAWGITGVSLGVVLSIWLMFFLVLEVSNSAVEANWGQVLRSILPGILIGLITAIAGIVIQSLIVALGVPAWLRLIFVTCTVLAVSAGTLWILPSKLLGNTVFEALNAVATIVPRQWRGPYAYILQHFAPEVPVIAGS